MGKNLRDSYKRLNVTEYTNVIKGTLIPYFDPFDGEFITLLTTDTVFTIKKHYVSGIMLGYNICANGELLETKSTKEKAERFLRKLGKEAQH